MSKPGRKPDPRKPEPKQFRLAAVICRWIERKAPKYPSKFVEQALQEKKEKMGE